MLEIALDKPEYKAGRDHDGRGHRAHRRPGHAQRDRRPADQFDDAGGAGRHRSACACRSAATGATAPTWSRPCAVRSTPRRSACRAARSACNGSRSTARRNTLEVDMNLPQLQRPNARCASRSRSTGSPRARRRASSSPPSIVGILNLTNYKPPAPDDHYLGQRRLTAELRDLYGQLIDGMQGTRGQIKTGGDAGRRARRQPAVAGAARALFRHRHREAGRHRRGLVRHPGVRRHRRASWRWPGARTRSAAPSATSPCAIRWC